MVVCGNCWIDGWIERDGYVDGSMKVWAEEGAEKLLEV